jgi:outer membrane protein assembly factor BamB
VFITPAVAGSALYIGSCSGRFYALDLATGADRWVYDTSVDGSPAQFHGDLLIAGGRLFVGSDTDPVGHLYAFDAASGRLAWKLPSPGGVPARVLGRDDVVYAQTAAGEVWAVDGATGELVWLHRAVGPGAAGRRQVDPLVEGDRLVVGWPSGDVEALDAATGDLLWRAQIGERLNTSLAAVGGPVLVGSMDGELHALTLADGRARPPIDLGGLPYGDLVAAGRCLLVLHAGDGHSLSCLDAASGATVWTRSFVSEIGTFRPLLLGDAVVIGYAGRLVALGLSDGADAWSCAVDGVARGLNADGDRMYVGMQGGTVTALPLAQCTGG